MPSKKNNYSTFLFQVEKPDFESRYTQLSAIVFLTLELIDIVLAKNDMTTYEKIYRAVGFYSIVYLIATSSNYMLRNSAYSKLGYLINLFMNSLSLVWLLRKIKAEEGPLALLYPFAYLTILFIFYGIIFLSLYYFFKITYRYISNSN